LQARTIILTDERPQPLLNWLCNSRNYAASKALAAITEHIGGLFRLIQGGSQFSPQLSEKLDSVDAVELPSIVGPVRQFVSSLERLAVVENVSSLVDEVATQTISHSRDMMAREVKYNNATEEEATESVASIEVT
jgi:hypothetical protein